MLGTVFFDDVATLAQFVAELVRQGVTFEARPARGGFEVLLTGGH